MRALSYKDQLVLALTRGRTRRQSEGWVYTKDGSRYWGREGAAGCLFTHGSGSERRYLLLQRGKSHKSGSWSVPGGAIKTKERNKPVMAALRESLEEMGMLPRGISLLGHFTYRPAEEWKYTTYVIQCEQQFKPTLNDEHNDYGWFTLAEASKLKLHRGLRELLEMRGWKQTVEKAYLEAQRAQQ